VLERRERVREQVLERVQDQPPDRLQSPPWPTMPALTRPMPGLRLPPLRIAPPRGIGESRKPWPSRQRTGWLSPRLPDTPELLRSARSSFKLLRSARSSFTRRLLDIRIHAPPPPDTPILRLLGTRDLRLLGTRAPRLLGTRALPLPDTPIPALLGTRAPRLLGTRALRLLVIRVPRLLGIRALRLLVTAALRIQAPPTVPLRPKLRHRRD
jgi:hypothetical protein